ncbi:chalcone isomerase family protein [Sansalvadorimonas verongulae]|uniref:chalcone isomerase family protein n=1 Tax=Sansalvadorimonas verongulae TaxID=2172824 RepID=UPI002E326FDF|nr:chalcone isomerase family protein [Sansalvadorimonas verongulae]
MGKTRLNILFWSIYDIELLTQDGFYSQGRLPLRLKITYLRDFTADSLVEQTSKEWRALGITTPKTIRWMAALQSIWPDVSEQDSLELHVDCDSVSRFYFNGMLVGTIADKQFAPAFVAIWLSRKTSQPEMRRELLANKTILSDEQSVCS